MEINPSEVTKILKEQIKKFGDKAEVTEVGQVLSVLLIFLLLLKDLFPFMPLSFYFRFFVIYF